MNASGLRNTGLAARSLATGFAASAVVLCGLGNSLAWTPEDSAPAATAKGGGGTAAKSKIEPLPPEKAILFNELTKEGVPDWAAGSAADLLLARDRPRKASEARTDGVSFNNEDEETVAEFDAGVISPGKYYQIGAEALEAITSREDKKEGKRLVTFRRGAGGTTIVPHGDGVTFQEIDDLAGLDAEVDLLASAMLGLEFPAGVIALYDRWYPTRKVVADRFTAVMRTPASVLLKAQAFRLNAWHALDPPPEVASLKAASTENRTQRMVWASRKLTQALQLVNASVLSLSPASGQAATGYKVGDPLRQDLAFWVRPGVPKPLTYKDATEGTFEFKPLPAGQAIEYARALLEWQARLNVELGDMAYRETGGAAVRRGGGNDQSTALAYYAVARGPLYLARLLGDDPNLAKMAADLGERQRWVRNGLGFRGADFYRFERYSEATYLEESFANLKRCVDALTMAGDNGAGRRSNQLAWLGNLREKKADRNLLRGALNDQARRNLDSSILGVEAAIDNLGWEQARAEAEDAWRSLDVAFSGGQFQLQQDQYQGELGLLMLEGLQDFAAGLQGLARHGVATEPPTGAAAGDLEKLHEFVEKQVPTPENKDTLLVIRRAWGEVERQIPGKGADRGGGNPAAAKTETLLDIRRREYDQAREEVARRQDYLQMAVRKAELKDWNKSRDVLDERLNKENAELIGLWEKFKDERKDGEAVAKAREIKDRVIPRLQRQVSQSASRLREWIGKVEEVKQKLQQVRKAVEDIKKFGKDVGEAKEKVAAVIRSAKAIPVTVAAGMTTGTFFDSGGAISDIAKAVLDNIVAVYDGKKDAQSLVKDVDDAENKVNEYLKKAQDVEDALIKNEADLSHAKTVEEALRPFEVGGTVHKQYVDREAAIKGLRDEHQAALDAIARKIAENERFLEEGNQRDLESGLRSAILAEDVARGWLEVGRREAGHRLGLLVSQREKIEKLGREISNAARVIAFYNKLIEKRTKRVTESDEKGKKVDADREKRKAELRGKLDTLHAEIAELNRPRNRLVTTDLIESLAPALALATVRPKPQETQTLIDDANGHLLRCARWLYVLGGVPDCVPLASPCSSLAELVMARDQVGELREKVNKHFEEMSPYLLILKIDPASLAKAGRASDGRSCVVRVVRGDGDRNVADNTDRFGKSLDNYVYDQPEARDGSITFRINGHEDHHGILLGFWILPGPGDPPRGGDRPPRLYPVLEPLGPIRRRDKADKAVTLPFKAGVESPIDRVVLKPHYVEQEVRKYIEQGSARGWDFSFVNKPYPGDFPHPPNIDVLGRGVEGLWKLSLEHVPDKPRLKIDALGETWLVFSYVPPKTKQASSQAFEARVRSPEFGFLRGVAGEGPAADDALFFGAEWKTHPLGSKARPDDPARLRRLDDLEAVLNGKADPPAEDPAPTELGPLIEEELGAVFGRQSGRRADPVTSQDLVRPVAVPREVGKAARLLMLLIDAVENEEMEQLKLSSRTLQDVHTRVDQVRAFTDALERQNNRFQALRAYVKDLKEVSGTLDGRALSDEESKELKRLEREDLNGPLLGEVATGLRQSPGTAPRAMIAHVLRRIIDEKYRPRAVEEK